MAFLDELRDSAGRAVQVGSSSVVRIGRDGGRGSGFVWGDGLVVTSAHNLRGVEVTVTFPGGRSLVGEVKGVDPDEDLAVVAVDTVGAPALAWSEDEPAVGEIVFAIGSRPGSGVRVTSGLVSAVGVEFRGPRGRLISDAVEHTAPVGRGSSGGPVVDGVGRLVAINTHRLGDGFYLARPVSASLREAIESLARGERESHRRLGIAVTPPAVAQRLRAAVGLPPRDGILVRGVADESPAAGAGIQKGDLIVSAGSTPVDSLDSLLSALDAVGPDGVLSITLVRGTEEVSLDVRFGPVEA